MSGETIYEAPRKYNASQTRVHDYLYDSSFIVSGARDYARTAFKAAMASAQVVIQPVYRTMFSELRKFPRMQVVYHPNCRLPGHVDRSYGAYMERSLRGSCEPPQLGGKDRFKFSAIPKKILNLKSPTLDFHPPSPRHQRPFNKPRNRGTQSLFRESSAQTQPWGPDAKPGIEGTVPEVMYLDKLEWGPGNPYRNGDLPADFHTTEIINKMRHARKWSEIVEKGQFPRYMKKQNAIISDIETKDWIFREAEIDELQDIRLSLLQKLKAEQQRKNTTRTSKKLAKLWALKKEAMEHKIDHIRRSRDRELRKLGSLHGRGAHKTEDLHAPPAREGYRASRRHADIVYDPSLLDLEDHNKAAEPPAWLEQCAQNLTKSCSGNHLPRDVTQLCERETKWSEQFLENLHNDLKKARLGAAASSAGPLRVLRPRYVPETPRPPTPDVEGVSEEEEAAYQAALVMQRIIRGRAVQILMFEGRTRAAELTEELKTTHGLQREDRDRIAKEEARARNYQAMRSEAEQKEQAISSLVQELCGGAVAAALDFLEKELRRLREERRQHAFILVALREKTMREAAEAGRRQKEEHRRREHDEMFKRVLGVTQETVDAYLQEVIEEGAALAAEQDAVKETLSHAERLEKEMAQCGSVSTAEQNELVAELVQQFLLPEAHKSAARERLGALQRGRMEAARGSLLGGLRRGETREVVCTRCGGPLDDKCLCRACAPTDLVTTTEARDDVRWKYTRRHEETPKTLEERYPPHHELRYLIDAILDDAVELSRYRRDEEDTTKHTIVQKVQELTEINIDAREMIDECKYGEDADWFKISLMARVFGKSVQPKSVDYHYFMKRVCEDALERTQQHVSTPGPLELPSEIRRKAEEAAALADPTCRCDEDKNKVKIGLDTMDTEQKSTLLPSELRVLEELRRCKCDTSPSFSTFADTENTMTFGYTETDSSSNVLEEEEEGN